ncbi:MAG TPA: MFS transporter [Stellaceae bacterium]|nr:MFS transporter [Stellaceae bacterium]
MAGGAAGAGSAAASRRTLAVACGAHLLHDGYTDLLYLLLPVWQAEFGLSLAALGLLKTLYSGFLAGFQVPAGLLAERIGERRLLALGTLVSGVAYLCVGWSGGFLALVLCLSMGGIGSSVQHPLSSALTSRAFEGKRQRAALSLYNFSGDVGKALLPMLTVAMIALWRWRGATAALGVLGVAAATAILLGLRGRDGAALEVPAETARPLDPGAARRGFAALSLIGVVDNATRTGFLTLLPFLLASKGVSISGIGVALSLVFAGGAAGKFCCGLIARRVGILRTVILTELATCAGILAVLHLSYDWVFPLLALLGVALNGTSSVLYGTVAEFADPARRARAFALFYTVSLSAGSLAPVVYGALSDALGVPVMLTVVALAVLAVIPLTIPLKTPLARHAVR